MIDVRRLGSFLQRMIPDIGALLLLLVLVGFFFWRVWAPNEEDWLRFPRGELTEQYYPLRRFVATTLAEGLLPFWNPYIFGGQPGLADPQAALFYPPALLNALFSYQDSSEWADQFPLQALQLEAIAHIALAACGTYLFVRFALRLAGIPALMAAIIFAFGGYLTGFPLQQLMILESVAWLPWLLLTLHYAMSQKNGTSRDAYATSYAGIALASLVFGCILLAGHLPSALYLIYLSVGYACLRLLRRGRTDNSPSPSIGRAGWGVERAGMPVRAALIAPFVLGAGLAAVQWLPSLAFIRDASKEALEHNLVQDGASWRSISELLLPQAGESSPFYVGLLSLLLMPVGFMSKGQRAEKRFWGAAALLALLLALTGSSTLFELLYLKLPHVVPLFGNEPINFHILLIWNWSVALLAAWGVSALLRMMADESQQTRMQHIVRRLAGLIPLLLLPLFVLWSLRALEFAQFELDFDLFTSFFDRYIFFVVILLFAWGILAWHSYANPTSEAKGWHILRFAFLLLALLLFDLFSVTRIAHFGGKAETSLIRENDAVQRLMALQEEMPDTPLRVGVLDNPRPRENDGMYWRIPLLSGTRSLRLESTNTLLVYATPWQQLQLRAATYIVAESDLTETHPDAFELLESDSSSHLLRIRSDMPYIWLIEQAEVISNLDELYHRLEDESFNPHQIALVEQELPPLAQEGVSAAELTLEVHAAGFAQVRISNSAESPLLLLFAEPSANGWHLLIDNEPQPWLRANGFNISTLVPPGEHLITLRYEQPGWQSGLMISGASLVVVLLMLAVGLRGVAVAPSR